MGEGVALAPLVVVRRLMGIYEKLHPIIIKIIHTKVGEYTKKGEAQNKMSVLLFLSFLLAGVTGGPIKDVSDATKKVAFVLNKSQCILALIVAACTFLVLVIVLVDLMIFSRRYRRWQTQFMDQLTHLVEVQFRYRPSRHSSGPVPRPRSGISDGTYIVSTSA